MELSEGNGHAEREAAFVMVERSTAGRATLGADRGLDVRGFVAALRARGVTPHVARNDRRWGRSAVDGRTTRHAGYALSQRRRKRVEWGPLLAEDGGRGPGAPRSRARLTLTAGTSPSVIETTVSFGILRDSNVRRVATEDVS